MTPRSPRGIVTPLLTPILQEDELDRDAVRKLIAHQVAAGVNGLLLLGTTGEGPAVCSDLFGELVDRTVWELKELNADIPVYVAVLSCSMADLGILTDVAQGVGAAGVFVCAPFYYRLNRDELRRWFLDAVAKSSLPIILYNNPAYTGVSIDLDILADLMEAEHVLGLKDSSGDLEYLTSVIELAARRRPDWGILVGEEQILVEALRRGASGAVPGGANLVPGLFVDLFNAHRRGDEETVNRLVAQVEQLEQLYAIAGGQMAPTRALKAALHRLGIGNGLVASPFSPLGTAQLEQVDQWLRSFQGEEYLPRPSEQRTGTQ